MSFLSGCPREPGDDLLDDRVRPLRKAFTSDTRLPMWSRSKKDSRSWHGSTPPAARQPPHRRGRNRPSTAQSWHNPGTTKASERSHIERLEALTRCNTYTLEQAEPVGFEPTHPHGRRFSRPVQYQLCDGSKTSHFKSGRPDLTCGRLRRSSVVSAVSL